MNLIESLPLSAFSWSDVYSHEECQNPKIYAWCAETNDFNSYLQVDFNWTVVIESISTWGDTIWNEWISSYRIYYSLDGETFVPYIFNPLPGNSNSVDEHINVFISPITAQYIRIYPVRWHKWKSMRISAIGYSLVIYTISTYTLYTNDD